MSCQKARATAPPLLRARPIRLLTPSPSFFHRPRHIPFLAPLDLCFPFSVLRFQTFRKYPPGTGDISPRLVPLAPTFRSSLPSRDKFFHRGMEKSSRRSVTTAVSGLEFRLSGACVAATRGRVTRASASCNGAIKQMTRPTRANVPPLSSSGRRKGRGRGGAVHLPAKLIRGIILQTRSLRSKRGLDTREYYDSSINRRF